MMTALRAKLRRLREKANEPSQTKNKWVWATNAAIIALMVSMVYGARYYVEHERQIQEDQQEVRIAELERFRCLQRADSREQLRGVLIGLALRLGAEDETLMVITDFIDTEYPAIDPLECPTLPMEEQ